MKIFGKTLSEYIAFQKIILILIVVVGVARLGLSLAGVPNSTAKWLSITAVMALGSLYYAIRVHTSGFGSYRQLLPLLFIQDLLAQLIIIAGILIAMYTGRDNIFSAPEYSGGGDGKNWLHVLAHLVLGGVIAPVLFWGICSLIMWMTKKATATDKNTATSGAQ
jgi:small basic protein